MRKRAGRHFLRLSLLSTTLSTTLSRTLSATMSAGAVILLCAGLFMGLAAPCFADDGPKPDPSGIATGDKTSAVDAAGNPFVVSAPTDKTAPDYAANRKAFDDY